MGEKRRFDGSSPRHALSAALSAALTLVASAATGQVMQPTGEIMPQPTGQAEIDVVTSRGFPADAVTLTGLFTYRGETVDPVANAGIQPGAFSPLCGFTGELVLRGGACKVAFGWYNVNPNGTPPAAGEIYVLVPPDPQDPAGLACADGDFCPLATMETTQAPQHSWTPRVFAADAIRDDPRYLGGLVGFALIGDQATNCIQTKYSQAELNQHSPSGDPWITTLIWQSTATLNAFYVGFEDLPTSADTWQGQGGGFLNDGDFNDFVYFVTGLTCEGGGQPCDTGMPGVCGAGITDCATDGMTLTCRQTGSPSDEKCDNIDNDCDGEVDEGDFCPESQVCVRGRCVGACGTGGVVCRPDLACTTEGFCVEPTCDGVVCAAGQVCRAGTCVDGCGGVVCPVGHICQLGACVDLCDTATCPADQICENGSCVQSCDCRECPGGKACASDGRCVDSGCEALTCQAGQACVAGACVDACAGAVCPPGELCQTGECVEDGSNGGATGTAGASVGAGGLVIVSINQGGSSPGAGGASTAAGGGAGSPSNAGSPGAMGGIGSVAVGGGVGTGASLGAGGSAVTSGAQPGVGPSGTSRPGGESSGGCGCRIDRRSTGATWLLAAGLLGLGLRRRSRRAA